MALPLVLANLVPTRIYNTVYNRLGFVCLGIRPDPVDLADELRSVDPNTGIPGSPTAPVLASMFNW